MLGEKRISMVDPLMKSRKAVADNLVSGMTSRRRSVLWNALTRPTLGLGWVKGDHGEHKGRRLRCNGNRAATGGVYEGIYEEC